MSLIGIDLGTSGVRAGLYGLEGEELASHSVDVALIRVGDLVEHDVGAVLGAVEDCISNIMASAASQHDPPQGLSFSVLGEAIVPLDADLHPLALGPVSMDPRGRRVAQAIRESLGEARFQEITGQPLHPMFSIFKIAADLDGSWAGDHVRHATFDAFVAARFGARFATDLSMAARTGAYDVEDRRWSREILDAVADSSGVRIAPEQLPEVVEAGTVIGGVNATAAARLGLPVGLPIVAGAHDQAASWVGVGGAPGSVSAFALGSSDCLTFGNVGRPAGLEGTGLATYPLLAGQWVTLAGTAAGGWALEWFAKLVGAPVAEVFTDLPEHPSPLLVLPYLVGSGTLDNDPAATGVIAGLTLGAGRREVASALVEAAGLELAKILSALDERGLTTGRIVATGGGSGNVSALRSRANAAGVPLTPYPGHASLRGAAMLAGIGVGLVQEVPSVTGPDTGPPEYQEWFTKRRRAYQDLYTSVRPLSL
ncbi:xylulokinase [Tessaracoccus terricola]